MLTKKESHQQLPKSENHTIPSTYNLTLIVSVIPTRKQKQQWNGTASITQNKTELLIITHIKQSLSPHKCSLF